MGYAQAGFTEIVGVDIEPQPNYPFDFIQGDALRPPVRLEDFDLIHASPPCQAYTVANNIWQRDHPDLLPDTRAMLRESGRPWIIENVPGAPMHIGPGSLFEPDRHGVIVCGLALGLNVKRHRLFEADFPLRGTHCPPGHPGDWLLVFGHTVLERGKQIGVAKGGGPVIRRKHVGTDRGREAMGIDWMTRDELSEAIPPAYTKFIGEQFLAQIGVQ
jgi:DNA (cytosine-5)-methyltransferase 1